MVDGQAYFPRLAYSEVGARLELSNLPMMTGDMVSMGSSCTAEGRFEERRDDPISREETRDWRLRLMISQDSMLSFRRKERKEEWEKFCLHRQKKFRIDHG